MTGVTCPKDDKPIERENYPLQVLKFTDRIWFVRCPRCNAYHQYSVQH